MVNNTVYQFLGSSLGVEIFLKNREHQKKGALKQRIEGSLYTLYSGFKKIPFKLYTYVLAQILQNGAKFIQKLTPGFKNHMRNFGQLQTCTGKSKKLKFDRLLLFKKYIPSVKTLYTEDLTFNYLCENSPNYLCHYIIFHDTTPLYFFS